MKPYILKTMLGVLALPLMTACSESDDWTPGPQDTETGVIAYFPLPNQLSYIFDSEGPKEEMAIDVQVSRQITDQAVSFPITVISDVEGVVAPASVDFAAGEASKTITIDCSGLPKGQENKFTLALPADQTDTYGEGMTSVTYSVINSVWVQMADYARYIYSYSDYSEMYPSTYGDIYQLDGTNLFKLTDFFGSGLDVTFTCDSADDVVFTPLSNALFIDDSYGGGWDIYNEAEQTYPVWVPGGLSGYPALTNLYLYNDISYSLLRMIYQKKSTGYYGYIGLTTYLEFDDGSWNYGAYQVDFTLYKNPFDPTADDDETETE